MSLITHLLLSLLPKLLSTVLNMWTGIPAVSCFSLPFFIVRQTTHANQNCQTRWLSHVIRRFCVRIHFSHVSTIAHHCVYILFTSHSILKYDFHENEHQKRLAWIFFRNWQKYSICSINLCHQTFSNKTNFRDEFLSTPLWPDASCYARHFLSAFCRILLSWNWWQAEITWLRREPKKIIATMSETWWEDGTTMKSFFRQNCYTICPRLKNYSNVLWD